MPDPHKRFTCHHPGCTSSYLRKEHLHRHQAQHTGRVTSPCPFCGRIFARRDTLRRHVRRDHAGSQSQLDSARAIQACQVCRSAKLRCRGGKPCTRCRTKGVQCVFDHPAARSGVENEPEPELEPEPEADADADLDASASQSNPSRQQGNAQADPQKRQGQAEDESPSLGPGLAGAQSADKDKTQHWVDLYFTRFHPHWPILHRATFDLAHEPPFLVQTVVMVGLWSNWARTYPLRDEAGERYEPETGDGNPTSQWPIATYQGILIYLIFSLVLYGTDHASFELSLTFQMSPSDRSVLSSVVETCLEDNIFHYPHMLQRYVGVEDITCIWVGVEEIKRFGLALYRVCCMCAGGTGREASGRPDGDHSRLLCLCDLDFPPPDEECLWEAGSNEELSRLLRHRNGTPEQHQTDDERGGSLIAGEQRSWISSHIPCRCSSTISIRGPRFAT
ncbi:hypothetical protein BDW60DRAFT_216314 [Aspergillus nidulans var. acristatus]